MSPNFERVTKLDAISRQLRTAIRLFFQDGDAVSIYTLTAAVQELLRGLHKARGLPGSLIKDSDLVRPEKAKEYRTHVNRPRNFFKHADEDPNEVLDFPVESIPIDLFDCVRMYSMLTGRMLREGVVFQGWLFLERPEYVNPGPVAEMFKNASAQTKDIRADKTFFLQLLNRADLFPNTD